MLNANSMKRKEMLKIEGNIINGFVKFHNIEVKFIDKTLNLIKKRSTNKKKYNFKIYFKIKKEAIDFFNIFIKRFNYFTILN